MLKITIRVEKTTFWANFVNFLIELITIRRKIKVKWKFNKNERKMLNFRPKNRWIWNKSKFWKIDNYITLKKFRVKQKRMWKSKREDYFIRKI